MNSKKDEIAIDEIIDSFAARIEQGEQPSIEEYKEKYPQLADQLDAVLPALVALENVDSQPEQRKLAVDDSIPQVIGDYEIVQEIGRGGMGIVFEALHTKMRRRVAMKVLPRSYTDRSSYLVRFLAEARSAGQLHHTNIVPVFEVGEIDGLHFYTMQYICGDNLDRVIEDIRILRQSGNHPGTSRDLSYSTTKLRKPNSGLSQSIALDMISPDDSSGIGEDADSASLSETERLVDHNQGLQRRSSVSSSLNRVEGNGKANSSLGKSTSSVKARTKGTYHHRVAEVGVQVAEGLDYAHRNGVLHRDIKPANLILDTDGKIWIADFGLAKLETEQFTQTGDIVGTLRYMAPERFDGDADGRSDIYSLGLTLYELCTLKSAFENNRGTLIKDVTNSSSVTQPRSIDRSIPADLETIILKAIDVQPENRYQTAAEMADDLELFLNNLPIRARRITSSERLWRFCKRNPVVSFLSASVFLLLLAVAIGSTLAAIQIKGQAMELAEQNRKAASHLALTEETIDRMLIRVGHELAGVPQLDDLRFGLFSDALTLQKEVLALEPENSAVTLKTVAAHRRMAKAQYRVGQVQKANETLKKTLELAESLQDDSADKFNELALVHLEMGGQLRTKGEFNESQNELLKAIAALGRIQPQDRNQFYLIRLAMAYRLLGAVQQQTGQVVEASASLQAAIKALDDVDTSEAGVDHADRIGTLAEVLNSLAIIHKASGELDKAEDSYRRSLDLAQTMGEMEFRNIEAAEQLGISALNYGNMLMFQKRHDEAAQAYEQAADVYHRLRRDFPMTIKYQSMAARSQLCLGTINSARNESEEAEDAYRKAIEQCSAVAAIHGSDAVTFDTHAVSLTNLGNLFKKQKRMSEAQELFEESIELREQKAAAQPDNLTNLKSLALTKANLADLYADEQDHESAYDLLLAADQLLQTLLGANPGNPSYLRVADFVYSRLGGLAPLMGKHSDVVKWVDRRTSLSGAGQTTVMKAVRTLERAAQQIENDQSLDEEKRQGQRDTFALHAVGLIEKLVESGWQPEQSLNQSEHLQWLNRYDEFQQLVKTTDGESP